MYKSKRIDYCFGNGLELLSASLVLVVCQDSKVFRIPKIPLSITLALLMSWNRVITTTGVSCNIWASFTYFYISNVFLSPRWKTPSRLTNVAPRSIGASRDFIHHIGLKYNRRPTLGEGNLPQVQNIFASQTQILLPKPAFVSVGSSAVR